MLHLLTIGAALQISIIAKVKALYFINTNYYSNILLYILVSSKHLPDEFYFIYIRQIKKKTIG